MLRTFARIIVILFTTDIYGSTDYQPSAFIEDTKFIGSLHQNNEVEMFIDDVKNNVKKQAYDSYVNSDILTQNELDIKLEPYLDNI